METLTGNRAYSRNSTPFMESESILHCSQHVVSGFCLEIREHRADHPIHFGPGLEIFSFKFFNGNLCQLIIRSVPATEPAHLIILCLTILISDEYKS
jgi:hypothetical protein